MLLRPGLARNVSRARTVRPLHTTFTRHSTAPAETTVREHDTDEHQQPSTPVFEAKGLPDPSRFPLYRPRPLSSKETYEPVDIDSLPTEEEIDIAIKEQITSEAIKNVEEYTEEDLRDFYRDVVLSGSSEGVPNPAPQIAAPKATTHAERRSLLGELSRRFLEPREEGEEQPMVPALRKDVPQHLALTAALMELAPEPRGPTSIPLGIVKASEWRALFDSFLVKSDPVGAEVLLSTMERHGVVPTTDDLNEVIALYAKNGQTSEVARLIQDFEAVGLPLTDFHRDMVINSALGPDGNVTPALDLLRSAEDMGQPFPQSSYKLVLQRLTEGSPSALPDSRTRAQAWDLFAHMRFAAHPVPTRELYTTMIRACAVSQDPQPERARDLWIEMAEDQAFQPTTPEYNAIIRALGSTKTDYLEAYDLLRQMLSKHEEATMVPFEGNRPGPSPWVPNLETFSALLEGTKRAGDLERARWVLNELVDLARVAAFSGYDGIQGPDEEMMSNIFQTYAAWRPRVRRGDIKASKGLASEANETSQDEGPGALVEAEDTNAEGSLAPTSRAEALREATVLFDAILHDTRTPNAQATAFHGVKITTRLLNSYLSVHFNHAQNLTGARETFREVWKALETDKPKWGSPAILPNGFSYLNVLERCARGRLPKEDRHAAQEWGWETWKNWQKWYEAADATFPASNPANRKKRFHIGLGERQIEKAWVAAIRLAALGEDTDRALDLLHEFTRRFPPEEVLQTYDPYIAPRFGIRMTEPHTVAEPHVPPHILFRDIDVLHNKLVRDEDWSGVNTVKWVCSAYEKSLRKRRRWRTRGAGIARERRLRQKALDGGFDSERSRLEGETDAVEDIAEESGDIRASAVEEDAQAEARASVIETIKQ